MKKLFISFLFLFSTLSLRAAEVALIYSDAEAVKSGAAIFGTAVSSGVLISAQQALSISSSPYISIFGSTLRSGALGRLDIDLNVAYLKLGDPVTNPDLLLANQNKMKALMAFIPSETRPSASQGILPSTVPTYSHDDPFVLKINGITVGKDEIPMLAKKDKSEFELEIVRTSTVPAWHVDLTLTTDPKVSFWKKQTSQTLTDVPRPTFNSSYQSMFKPMGDGDFMKLNIQVFFIKQEAYVWTFKIKSKNETFEKKVLIRFHQ